MDLKEHIEILRNIRVPYKYQLIQMLWAIFEDHHKEIKNIDYLLNEIYSPLLKSEKT